MQFPRLHCRGDGLGVVVAPPGLFHFQGGRAIDPLSLSNPNEGSPALALSWAIAPPHTESRMRPGRILDAGRAAAPCSCNTPQTVCLCIKYIYTCTLHCLTSSEHKYQYIVQTIHTKECQQFGVQRELVQHVTIRGNAQEKAKTNFVDVYGIARLARSMLPSSCNERASLAIVVHS